MLELWQSSRMQCSRLAGVTSCTVLDCVGGGTGCSEGEARARVRNVVKQHAATLRALGAFAARGANRVVIVPGNHDAALLFPSVVAVVTQARGECKWRRRDAGCRRTRPCSRNTAISSTR
jgi:hypothetical protein